MSQCGPIPEFSLAPNSNLSAVDLTYEEQEVGNFMGQSFNANIPSGASLNPAFIESISGQFTDYLQSDEIKQYASCRIDEAKGDLDLSRLEEIGDKGVRLMNSLAPSAQNLNSKITTLMDNADTFKDEFDTLMNNADTFKGEFYTLKGKVESRSKEITLNSLNNIQSTVENFRVTISLVLTIVAFLVILIFINIMQRLIPKSWKVGVALIGVLSFIFAITYLMFDSLYNNKILKPLVNKSNIIREKLGAEPVDESEESDWIFFLVLDVLLVTLIILGLIVVNINSSRDN